MLSVMSLFFEAKKTIFKPHIYIVITLFLIINHLSCLQYIERHNAEFSSEYLQAEIEIHEKIDGNITQEKVSWIINEKQRLNSIISSGQFSTDYKQTGTYTGYVYSDNNLINKIYDELKYNVEYHLFAQEVVDGARENIELYKSKNNHTKVAFYQYMADAFSSRSLNTFYRTDGWNEYYTYSFSNLLIVLSMLLGLTSTFSIETDLKIRPVLQITPKSMRTINFQKVLLSMLFTVIITTIFSVQDLLIFLSKYNLQGFNNPIYAVPSFQHTPISISIAGYTLMNWLYKIIGFMCFASCILLCSKISHNGISAYLYSIIIFILNIFANSSYPALSFMPMLNSINIYQDFNTHSLERLSIVVAGILLSTFITVGFPQIHFLQRRRNNGKRVSI